jgi:type I restriction enzyme S subunit
MVVAGLHTVACRPHEGLFAPRYLGYYINSSAYHNQLLSLITGTKVSSVSRAGFLSTYVILPPLHEQKAIADALSDVDELLAVMTALIEKKRAIKQGAMQELLGMRNEGRGIRNEELGVRNCEVGAKKVPRRRLPGFSGEWKIVRIGEISKLVNGYAFKSETYTDDGQFSVITIANVQDGKFILESVNKINDLPNDIQGHQILHKGDVIISMTGNVGRVCRVTQEKCLLNQRVGKFESIEIDTSFFYLSLRTKRFISTMIDKGQGGAQPNIGKYDISSYEIMVPSLPEQKAIAEVLSDMDAEIEALEAKRAKYESIKQGMMQELLTGKTRLKGA